ncbi:MULTISPECIES: type ISP restriction/modification enzyme [Streptomyces]|uniref:Type ISP restriction-modification enzyme LLaBIII C-terminal specificity domain-containing protein n=1 Tax=Streptomyces sanyensis TaxID=568869 RepID=A0ABP9B3V5_9ACTN
MRTVSEAPESAPEDVPLLDDLMPWSVPPLRPGRSWVMAPDAASLRRRWEALTGAEDAARREELFRPTRSRTPHSTVAQLPGQPAGTGRIARETGPCPEPVRVLHGAYDQQWLIPDQRLLDVARPELWRVRDARQVFVVEQGRAPGADGPALVATAHLPDGRSPAGRPGRIRPLYRRPGGREANIAPGLADLLADRYGHPVTAEELLCWTMAAARPGQRGAAVPLTADAGRWARGVALGRRMLDVQLRGAHGGERPRLPGGRRPYVRAALPRRPGSLAYEEDGEALLVGGTGRIAPVPRGAWTYAVAGERVLEQWFRRRTEPGEAGTLEALRPAAWPQEWTSELLELVTVLALLAELRPQGAALGSGPLVPASALRAAGVLPPPPASRRPASVLEAREEGPEGQLALL